MNQLSNTHILRFHHVKSVYAAYCLLTYLMFCSARQIKKAIVLLENHEFAESGRIFVELLDNGITDTEV